MRIIHVALEPPLAEGRARLAGLRRRKSGAGGKAVALATGDPALPLSDRIAALVDEGAEGVIVDLDRLPTPEEQGIKMITELVWSVLATGAQPVVVAGGRDTLDVVRHYKMDRAFAVLADLDAAVEHLSGDR